MKGNWLLHRVPRITTTVLVTVVLLACATVVNAAGEKLDDRWHFTITPFVWLPYLSATDKLESPPDFPSGELETGPGNYLQYLDFVGMLDLQVQKGRWSLLADVVYVDFSGNQRASFPGILAADGGWTIGADWGLKALILEFAGAYSVFRNKYLNFDLLAGARYAGIDGKVALDISGPLPAWVLSRTFSETAGFVDPIIGFKGKFEPGRKWYFPYYFDIGGFGVGSDLTLHAHAGIGFRFCDWFSMALGYRYLYYDFGENKLVNDLKLYGATLGLSFSF